MLCLRSWLVCAATALHVAADALLLTAHDPCPAIYRLLERSDVTGAGRGTTGELDRLLDNCRQTHSGVECNEVVSTFHKRCFLDRGLTLDLATMSAASAGPANIHTRGSTLVAKMSAASAGPVNIHTSGTGWGYFGDGISIPRFRTGTSFRGPGAPPGASDMDKGMHRKHSSGGSKSSNSAGALQRGADALHALDVAGVGGVSEPGVSNRMPSFVPLSSGGASRASTITYEAAAVRGAWAVGEGNAAEGATIAAARENPSSTDRVEAVESASAAGLPFKVNETIGTPPAVVMPIVTAAPGVTQAIEAGIVAGLATMTGEGQAAASSADGD